MAVAHSAASESHTGTTGSTNQTAFSWTHTQTGTPQGVLVFVHTISASDFISSVTYGTVTLERVAGAVAIDATTEPGRTDLFFAGSGLASGNQTITVNRTNNGTTMYASAATVTAATDVNVTGIVVEEDNQALAPVAVDDGSPGTNSVRYAATYYGANSPAPAGTGSTLLTSIDLGSFGNSMVRETTAGQGAQNVGFNASSDDVAAVYVAVRELFNRTETPIVGDFTLTGNPADLAKINPKVIEPAVGAFALTGNEAGLTASHAVTGGTGVFSLPERNLVTQSQGINPNNGAVWSAFNASLSSGAITAPDGTQTAHLLTENTATTTHAVTRQFSYKANTFYTWSCHFKKYGGPAVRQARARLAPTTAGFGSLTEVIADLDTGTISLVTGTGATAAISDEGNGWYRLSITRQATTGGSVTSSLGTATSANASSYTGDGLSGVYLWGAQLEESSAVTAYDRTGPVAATPASLDKQYKLDGGTGAFTLTGNDATLVKASAKVLTADTGAFALSGGAPDLRVGHNLEPAVGVFTLTGNPAGLADTDELAADRGVFSLGGNAAALFRTWALDANAGTFAFTGNAAALADTDQLSVEVGTFVLTGNDATAVRAYALIAEAGTFIATGEPATLRHNPRIEAATGSFALTGNAPALLRGHYLSGGAGEFIETGQPATFRRTWAINATAGNFALTGRPAALTELGAYEIDPIVGTFTLAGQPAQLAKSRSFSVDAGTYTLDGQPATLRQSQVVSAEAGIFQLTGNAATIRRNRNIEAAAGAFALTGNDATLTQSYLLTGDTGAFTFTGNAATLAKQADKQLAADAGIFTLAGQPATLTVARLVSADRGLFTLTGQPATPLLNRSVTALAGTFNLVGQGVTFNASRALAVEAGVFSFTGNSVALTEAGDFQLIGATGAFALTGFSATLAKTSTARRRNVLIF